MSEEDINLQLYLLEVVYLEQLKNKQLASVFRIIQKNERLLVLTQ